MFKSHLIIAIRNILKQKAFSLINISGLAVGMACCLLIVLWIQDELSFDRFHEQGDRIYRVTDESTERNGRHTAHTPAPYAQALLREFPEITAAVRFDDPQSEFITYENKQFWVKGFSYADPEILEVFSFPLLRGNAETALKDTRSIVISEEMARKFFGDADPLGRTLKVGSEYTTDYHITGIMKNIPANSQLQFDCLVSFHGKRGNIGWGQWNYTTYVLLSPNAGAYELEQKFPAFVDKYLPETTRPYTRLHLQPLWDIHLHSKLHGDHATNRDIDHVYIFSAIGLLILILALINFINLSTGRAAARFKEVGVRKVVGARRSQLIKQFLTESCLLAFAALFLGLLLVDTFLPVFNNLAGKQLHFGFFENLSLLLIAAGITLFTGLAAGIYPAFFLSAPPPTRVFTQHKGQGRTPLLRRILVISQFAVSIIFIACTLIVHGQLQYIQDKDLGYDKDHLLILPIFYTEVQQKYGVFKEEILRHPAVFNAAATAYHPSRGNYHQNARWEGMPADLYPYLDWIPADHDFIKTLGLELTAGRDFSKEFPTDTKEAYILNEAAVKEIGWENPIGKWLEIVKRGTVIGVVKDFHYKSLHNSIGPAALYIWPEGLHYLMVRISAADMPASIAFLGKKWEQFFPARQFEYFFFDEDFDRLYKTEMRLGEIFDHVAGLAIFIACLGLFGLASFTAEQRTKEIGIRKVFGAAVSQIVVLLSEDFARWVLLANLAAWPLTWYIMSRWLQNFAYRADLTLWPFLLAGIITLLIALLTIITQTVKAATANPVETLKHE